MRKKPVLVAVAVVVAVLLAWWIFVKPSIGSRPLSQETFTPQQTEAAYTAAGFTPLEPQFTPDGYALTSITVSEMRREARGKGPIHIGYLYQRGDDTYLLSVSSTTMSLEDLLVSQPLPHSTLQRLDLRGREVVLQTEDPPEGVDITEVDQLEALAFYQHPGGFTYEIDVLSTPGQELGPDTLLEVLASIPY